MQKARVVEIVSRIVERRGIFAIAEKGKASRYMGKEAGKIFRRCDGGRVCIYGRGHLRCFVVPEETDVGARVLVTVGRHALEPAIADLDVFDAAEM